MHCFCTCLCSILSLQSTSSSLSLSSPFLSVSSIASYQLAFLLAFSFLPFLPPLSSRFFFSHLLSYPVRFLPIRSLMTRPNRASTLSHSRFTPPLSPSLLAPSLSLLSRFLVSPLLLNPTRSGVPSPLRPPPPLLIMMSSSIFQILLELTSILPIE